MKVTEPDEIKENITIFQIFMVVLSVYVLAALYVDFMFDFDRSNPKMAALIDNIDFIICLIFQGDFFYRLHKAPSKLKFLRWGWIDFISSIPMLSTFRGGKMVRAIRILRLLRAFRSFKILVQYLLRNRSHNTFVTVAAISCFIALAGSMGILSLEKGAENGNIKNASDALWWSIVTITTVGYGDRYPVTDGGRIIAAILMTAGVGLFGTFTGFIASMFVEPDIKREENEVHGLATQIKALRSELRAMDQKITRQNRQMNRDRRRKQSRSKPGLPPEDPKD
ncbi:MAG: ion transporter [Verrucomicrobiota bacterium]